MDDDDIGIVQAHMLHRVLRLAGIGLDQLWWEYFSLGGDAGKVETEAYLHHCLRLPPLQRDLLAHAANGLMGHGSVPPAPYSSDLLGPGDDAGRGGRHEAPGRGTRS